MTPRPIEFRAWDEKYEVGSDGSVWSLNYNHTGKRKRLKTYLDQDGYPHVYLVSGKRIKKMVHRLVAELFLVKPTPQHQVNHKNGKRNDSKLSNLEWVTPSENALHGWRVNGRKASAKHIASSRERMKAINQEKWKKEGE